VATPSACFLGSVKVEWVVRRFPSLEGRGLFLLLFIWFLWFTNLTSRTILAPVLPLIEDEFVTTHARASSIIMFIAMGYTLSLLLSGLYARLLGYKKSIVVCFFGGGVVLLLLPTTGIFEMLYVFCFFLGGAAGFYLPAMLPLLTSLYEEKVWGRVFSIHESAPALSNFCTPFIALLILSFFGWRAVFIACGLFSLGCGVAACFLLEDVKPKKGPTFLFKPILKKSAFWLISILWVFLVGCNLGVYYIIPLYLTKELSIDMGYANTILGFSRLGGVLAALSTGFLVERFGLRRSMFGIMLATGLLTIALVVKDPVLLMVFLFLQAAISFAFFPMVLISISRTFEQEMRGQATAFVITLATIGGNGVVPYLLGLSGDLMSFSIGIGVLGILTSTAAGLIWFLKELR
jgi:MFS family permease